MDGGILARQEVRDLVRAGLEQPHELFILAHRLRAARFGNAVKLCSIIPGKLGGCGEDCKWCAQSAACGASQRLPSRASVEDILAAAGQARRLGAGSFGVVNSGRRPSEKDIDDVLNAVSRMRAESGGNLRLCASLGELTDLQARRLAAGGICRYNHNLETSREFFPSVVTTHGYDDRMRTVSALRRAGISICCGGIFGLGETWDDRIDLALALRDEVRPDVVPLNFLHPIPGTPLEHATPLAAMEILIIIAVFRLVLPEADLKIAGGREKNLRDLQSWMFYVGGTSIIIGNYLTTAGRLPDDDLRMIADLGLRVVPRLPPEDKPARQVADVPVAAGGRS